MNKVPYAHIVENVEDRMWEYSYNEEDNSFFIAQSQLSENTKNKILHFGPLQTNLQNLFFDGFELQIYGNINSYKQKLRLVRGREVYIIARGDLTDFLKKSDFGIYIEHTKNYLLRSNAASREEFEHSVKAKHNNIEVDHFDVLMKKYPTKRSRVAMVGNQTLKEYVKQQLKG